MGFTWQYYDLVLLGIVLSMGVGVAVGALTPIGFAPAVVIASLVAVAIITHGLFVNGPVEDPSDLADDVDVLN